MKHPTYFSQWGSEDCNLAVVRDGHDPAYLHDWAADGYESAESYRYWSFRTCGIACLQSILDACRIPIPPKATLIERALKYQAYIKREDSSLGGLYYEPFVTWIRDDFGLSSSSRGELPLVELMRIIERGEHFIIASVSKEIRDLRCQPTRRGGHLVLVYNVSSDGKVIFHNPSGVSDTAARATAHQSDFARFYAGRGILVERQL